VDNVRSGLVAQQLKANGITAASLEPSKAHKEANGSSTTENGVFQTEKMAQEGKPDQTTLIWANSQMTIKLEE